MKCCCFPAKEKLASKFQEVPQYLMEVARVFVAHSKDVKRDMENRWQLHKAATAAAASLCQHE